MLIENNIVKEFRGTYNGHEVYEVSHIAATSSKPDEVLLSILTNDLSFAEENDFHMVTDGVWEKLIEKEEVSELVLITTDISTGKSEERAATFAELVSMHDNVEPIKDEREHILDKN